MALLPALLPTHPRLHRQGALGALSGSPFSATHSARHSGLGRMVLGGSQGAAEAAAGFWGCCSAQAGMLLLKGRFKRHKPE